MDFEKMKKLSCTLTVVLVLGLYVFVRNWRTIYTKTFTAYKLYLNKKDEANKTDYIYIEFHFIATT